MSRIWYADFGNRSGSHSLIGTNLPGEDPVLESLRFVVDRPAGHVGMDVSWSPYWGCGPVQDWWAIWRGEEDVEAPRKNMVTAKAALIRRNDCGELGDLESLLQFLGGVGLQEEYRFTAEVMDALIGGQRPVVVMSLSAVPSILRAIWKSLWPELKRMLSIRPAFGLEVLESGNSPHIVVAPSELYPRWRSYDPIDKARSLHHKSASWITGRGDCAIAGIVEMNRKCLTGDFTVLQRIDRINNNLAALSETGTSFSIALLVIRTAEAMGKDFRLPGDSQQKVVGSMGEFQQATVSDIRGLSLMRMELFSGLQSLATTAVTVWIRQNLQNQSDTDAIWILDKMGSEQHCAWWRTAVVAGVQSSLESPDSIWAAAIWRWARQQPGLLPVIGRWLSSAAGAEKYFLETKPTDVGKEALEHFVQLCSNRQWGSLLATLLAQLHPLPEALSRLRAIIAEPASALDVLLCDRTDQEIIAASLSLDWDCLWDRAVAKTLGNPTLLLSVPVKNVGFNLLDRHLQIGGTIPEGLVTTQFFEVLCSQIRKADERAYRVFESTAPELGRFIVNCSGADELLGALPPPLMAEAIRVASEAWLQMFLERRPDGRPCRMIAIGVIGAARSFFRGLELGSVLAFVGLFSEIGEADFESWLTADGHRWSEDDDQLVGEFLVERQWKRAATSFRHSWKSELKSSAWFARELLSWWDTFLWSRPDTSRVPFVPKAENRVFPGFQEEVSVSIHVGIVTMKEEEYDALLAKFSPSGALKGRNRDYDCVSLPTQNGECRVAITRCNEQGNAHAQNAVTELLGDLSPDFVLVVGIAGGVPTVDFCLGDVVVSNYIQDLTLEDTGSSASDRRFNALGGPLHPSATRIVERLRSIERSDPAWNSAEAIECERPSLEGRVTTNNKTWNKDIEKALKRHSSRVAPIATARKIASSDRLIKDPELLTKWRTVLKAVAAVEMEAAGAYIPCQRNGVPVLAVRGISDIVGWERDEAWTLYACHTAAAYVAMLTRAGAFCSSE